MCLQVVKVSVQIFICIYLIGLLWINYVKIQSSYFKHETDFIKELPDIYQKENIHMSILCSYFAFTTLSTTGLGDLTPQNNSEYILMIFIFLFGVLVFSMVSERFGATLIEIQNLQPENEHSEDLHKFLNLMKQFNYGKNVTYDKQFIQFF